MCRQLEDIRSKTWGGSSTSSVSDSLVAATAAVHGLAVPMRTRAADFANAGVRVHPYPEARPSPRTASALRRHLPQLSPLLSRRTSRPKRKNRTGPSPRPSEADPMRLCPCWGWDPASGCLDLNLYRTATGGVRVQLPHPKRPNNWRNLDPLERTIIPFIKNPSAATAKRRTTDWRMLTPAPASTMSIQPILLPPACCRRGTGLRVTSPIHH
jgi:hypothetical protein